MRPRRWLKKWLLRLLCSLYKKETVDENTALINIVEAQTAKAQALEAADKRRGELHRQLKTRLKARKKENKRQKEDIRDLNRLIKQQTSEIKCLRHDAALWSPFAKEEERQRKSHARDSGRVWKHAMRLGVLHQYSPRPMIQERFPKLAAPSTWPQISVITPCYNHAVFLERTMRSVLNQRYTSLQYLVMDGGSQDDTVDIIQKYSPQLAGWESAPDRGAAHAINKGFAKATGEIMTWLNSDDLWTPGVLSFVAAWFSKHPDVDVVYGHRLIVDERDNQVGHWVLPRHDAQMLLWADYIPQETMFWRRGIWEKCGGRLDESYQFAFDWELLLRFQRAGAKMVRVPWFMGCFRVHPTQKSSADIATTGVDEMKRLRERELGSSYSDLRLERHVISFQKRALYCEKLRRFFVRW